MVNSLPFQVTFNTQDYSQMYKTLQLFTIKITFNMNKFTSIKLLKTHMCTDTKLLKMLSSLKLGSN